MANNKVSSFLDFKIHHLAHGISVHVDAYSLLSTLKVAYRPFEETVRIRIYVCYSLFSELYFWKRFTKTELDEVLEESQDLSKGTISISNVHKSATYLKQNENHTPVYCTRIQILTSTGMSWSWIELTLASGVRETGVVWGVVLGMEVVGVEIKCALGRLGVVGWYVFRSVTHSCNTSLAAAAAIRLDG